MSLVNCKECKKEISSTVKACPFCGMENKSKSDIGGAIIWGIIIFGVVLSLANSDKKSSTGSSYNAKSTTVIQVEIRDILNAYKNNEVGADNKYINKRIRVTGIVSDIKKDFLDNLYVTLGTGRGFEIPEIQAFFDGSMSARLGNLNKGTKLTVECTVDGLMMNVIAKKCVIK